MGDERRETGDTFMDADHYEWAEFTQVVFVEYFLMLLGKEGHEDGMG